MGIKEIHIPIYDWNVVIFYNIHEQDDYIKIQDFCNSHLVDMEIINGLLDNIKDKVNNASHVCNPDLSISYIFYNSFVTEADFWKIFTHEIGHVIDYMSKKYAFDTEAASYVRGYLYQQLYLNGIITDIRNGYLNPSADPLNQVKGV